MPASAPHARRLDERRLHLNHGPIDLVIEVWGAEEAIQEAHRVAMAKFEGVLPGLVDELALLRRATDPALAPEGRTARRMWCATRRFEDAFVTPMASVAGAVADQMASEIARVAGLEKLCVNNGGDIAVWLGTERAELRVGVALLPAEGGACAGVPAAVRIRAGDGVGGVASSGWQGRSHSLGIADSVTVLAENAALADAAATLIANAVDVDSPEIRRVPARELDIDSDLGDRPVTVSIGTLSAAERREALARGEAAARRYLDRGLVVGAYLTLGDAFVAVGDGRALEPVAS